MSLCRRRSPCVLLTVRASLSNTCFLNSTLQCLANTPGLTEFFTEGKYSRFINRTNPLGFRGKIADEYGALLKEIWSGQYSTVTPRGLKQVIGEFSPRFAGYSQQDSSELLSFLLDGLHEDLNRVLKKPLTQPVESAGRTDAVVAAESWDRHLQRNQSVIVDSLQGQLKSCVVCPQCDRQSITFDPFMFLSVPLPVPNTRELSIVVVQTGAVATGPAGTIAPCIWPLRVSKDGITIAELKAEVRDLLNASPSSACLSPAKVNTACLISTEIYQNRIFKVLAQDFTTNKFGKQDVIVFYHVPEMEANGEAKRQEHTHHARAREYSLSSYRCASNRTSTHSRQRQDTRRYSFSEMNVRSSSPVCSPSLCHSPPFPAGSTEQMTTLQCIHQHVHQGRSNRIGLPMVLAISTDQLNSLSMLTLRATIKRAVSPWLNHGRGWNDALDDDREMYDIILMDRGTESQIMPLPYTNADGSEDFTVDIHAPTIQFHRERRTGASGMSFALRWRLSPEVLADRLIQNVDQLAYPEHIRSARESAPKKTGLDLSDCLAAFAKEETLRKTEAWYCSQCKDHMEATKKFDLWRVPDILIIHLKRFTYDTYRRDKIDSYVDFPLENLDLSPFMVNEADRAKPANTLYDLYAVSNHYGGLGGGHYTAYARNLVNQQWYNLDDSSATRINQPHTVKTNAAYVRRRDGRDRRAETDVRQLDRRIHQLTIYSFSFPCLCHHSGSVLPSQGRSLQPVIPLVRRRCPIAVASLVVTSHARFASTGRCIQQCLTIHAFLLSRVWRGMVSRAAAGRLRPRPCPCTWKTS